MLRNIQYLIFICFYLGVTNCAISQNYPPEIPTASKVEIYKSIEEVELKAWIFNPPNHQASDKRPAIVFFFGGGWNGGTPAQFIKHCEYLAARGMVAITVDYRVFKRQGVKPAQCVADAKSAIRWMRKNATELGVNPNEIVAAGGSAGGHLAASTATLPDYEEATEDLAISSIPNATALFNPVLLTASLADKYEIAPKVQRTLLKRMGTTPSSLSPVHHIKAGMGPSIIFHGTADNTVPYRTAEIFHKMMNSKGNDCTLVTYNGEGHGFFNYGRKNNGPFVDTVQKLDDFLVKIGYLEMAVLGKFK
ncbi:MAG: alpha/beta hydrolase [Saprospiraceae bacterium]